MRRAERFWGPIEYAGRPTLSRGLWRRAIDAALLTVGGRAWRDASLVTYEVHLLVLSPVINAAVAAAGEKHAQA